MTADHEDPIPTGVPGLDDELGGGLPVGTVVALSADPASPSEELLYPPLAATPGRYLTLLRAAEEVRAHVEACGLDGEALDVRATTGTRLLDDPAGHLSGLDARSVVVVDPVTELEREGRDRYGEFLDTLVRATRTTESVAILHCLRMNPRALQRDLTLARADAVLDFETYTEVGSDGRWAGATLSVRKSRFGHAPVAPVEVAFDGTPAVVNPDG